LFVESNFFANFDTISACIHGFLGLIFSLILVPFGVFAYLAPDVYVEHTQINKVRLSAGEEISGSFILHNNDKAHISGLVQTISIIQKNTDGSTRIISRKDTPLDLSIAPKSTRDINYTFTIPSVINAGDYIFRIRPVLSGGGAGLGWEDRKITIEGDANTLLLLDDAVLLQGEESFELNFGPTFSFGEQPKVRFTIQKTAFDQIVEATPHVVVYERNKTEDIVQEYDDRRFAVITGDIIELDLPLIDIPGVYLAEIQLRDSADEHTILSETIAARWVVEGVSARILEVKIDHINFKKGENIVADINYVGSADGVSESGEIVITAELLDKKGNIIGSAAIDKNKNQVSGVVISRGQDSTMLTIPVTKSSSGETHLRVSLSSDGVELDAYEKIFAQEKNNKSLFFGGIILILLLLGLIVGFMKKQKYA